MSEVLEILKYTIPALIVLIATVLIIKQMVKNNQSKRNYEIVSKNQQIIKRFFNLNLQLCLLKQFLI